MLVKALGVFLISASMIACGKSGGGSSTPETDLAVTTTPAAGSNQAAAPGPTFALNVTVTSTMPPKGVTIAVSASIDGQSNSAFYTTSSSTTAASNNFTITNTPAQQTCLVTITVTSNTKSSNTVTITYRYAMK
jgi:hypothetical protein